MLLLQRELVLQSKRPDYAAWDHQYLPTQMGEIHPTSKSNLTEHILGRTKDKKLEICHAFKRWWWGSSPR